MDRKMTITVFRRKRGYIMKQLKKGDTFLVVKYNRPVFRVIYG